MAAESKSITNGPLLVSSAGLRSQLPNLLISDNIRRMSNTAPPPAFPPGPSAQMPWPPRGPARWPIAVMCAITLVAVAAAIAAWLRPMAEAKSAAPSAPTFSAQQVTDAKSNVCAAYAKIHQALDVNAPRNGGSDPTAQLAVATNMRQIYVVGSAYLVTKLADEPATPSDLAAATSKGRQTVPSPQDRRISL